MCMLTVIQYLLLLLLIYISSCSLDQPRIKKKIDFILFSFISSLILSLSLFTSGSLAYKIFLIPEEYFSLSTFLAEKNLLANNFLSFCLSLIVFISSSLYKYISLDGEFQVSIFVLYFK